MLCCAGLLTVALTVALVDHPLAYALRVKVVALFSGEPGVALDFQREPADRPVLTSETAETPMIVDGGRSNLCIAMIRRDLDGCWSAVSAAHHCRLEAIHSGLPVDSRSWTTGS